MASTIKFSRPPILAFLLLLLMSFLYISLAAYCGSMGGSSGESSPVSSGGGSSFSSGGRGCSSWDYIDSGGSRGQGGGRRGSKVDVIIFVTGVVILVLFCAGFMIAFCCSEYQRDRKRKKSEQYRREPIKSEQYTLIMVQVGLMGTALSLQNELNEISSTANTSTARGWHRILTTELSGLSCVGASTISRIHDLWLFTVEKYSTTGVLLMRFKQLSSEENEKCDAGSLVNFNNVNIQREGVPGKNYVVVTILVAANGMYKVPAIRSTEDIKGALLSLNVDAQELEAVEVLWTPQVENETLSEQGFLQNYPRLRPDFMT